MVVQHLVRAETIAQPAARNLKQCIGPDKGAEDHAHGDFAEVEFLADHGAAAEMFTRSRYVIRYIKLIRRKCTSVPMLGRAFGCSISCFPGIQASRSLERIGRSLSRLPICSYPDKPS